MSTTPLRADLADLFNRAAVSVDPANDPAILMLRQVVMGYDPGSGTSRRTQLGGDGLLVSDSVSTRDQKLSYDTSGNLQYLAEAPQGTATSAAAWTVAYLQYDASGNLTTKTTAYNAVWDNRASLSYT
jgi:YD repeat-containing protein